MLTISVDSGIKDDTIFTAAIVTNQNKSFIFYTSFKTGFDTYTQHSDHFELNGLKLIVEYIQNNHPELLQTDSVTIHNDNLVNIKRINHKKTKCNSKEKRTNIQQLIDQLITIFQDNNVHNVIFQHKSAKYSHDIHTCDRICEWMKKANKSNSITDLSLVLIDKIHNAISESKKPNIDPSFYNNHVVIHF